jgi:nucleoside-triphosphatase THEP1
MPPQKKKTATNAKNKMETNALQVQGRRTMLEKMEDRDVGDDIVQQLYEAMTASSKDDGIDWATRLRAIEMWLNRTMGLPIRREERIHRSVSTVDELQEMLNHSAEFRKTVKNMLDKAAPFVDAASDEQD